MFAGTGNIITQGADLLAGDAITLSGRAIDLQAVSNETRSHSVSEARSLTIGSALAGSLGTQITAISDKIEQARNTDNSRLQGALVLKAGYDAYKLTQGKDVTSVDATGTTEATTQAAQVAKAAQIAQAREVTGSVSASEQSIKHSYLSAVGQSGIAAGDGGFDIRVKGATELVGAAITSSAAASDNRLTTASLSSRDLQNAQSTQSQSSSISVGYSGASMLTTLAGNAAQNVMGNLQSNAALPKNGSQSGTTQSVISPATITITGSGDAAKDASSRQTAEQLTARDAASANGSLTNTLTLQQAQALPDQIRRQQENMGAAKLVGAVLSNMVGDLASSMTKPVNDALLRQQLDAKLAGGGTLTEIERTQLARLNRDGVSSESAAKTLADPAALATYANWQDGSVAKIALHGMVGLIEAKIGGGSAAAGALGAMSQEAMAPILSDYLEKNGFVAGRDDYKALMQLGATLVGTAVGTLATGDVLGASTGANAAFVGVTNNYLTHQQIDQKQKELANCKSVAACKAVEDKWKAIDQQQTADALTFLVNGKGNSVMMSTDTLKQARDQLQKDCAAFCSADAMASLNELNGYFLPNGDINQEALRTGKIDLGRFVKAGINLAGSIAGVGTGAILATAGGALVVAPEPTGVSKVAGAVTATTGAATFADSSYGVYSNAVNLYRATQGSAVYLPDSGSGWLAEWLVPGSQAAQDIAQIGSLGLALVSGRVYVGTALKYGDSVFAQYVPLTINGMLDASAAAPSGMFKFALIPTTNPKTSTASMLLDQIQWAQVMSTDNDTVRRLLQLISSEGGQQ